MEEDGKWVVKHTSNIDFVQDHMQLTDMDTVLTIAEAGVTQAAQERKTRFDQFYGISVARTSGLVVQETAAANAVSVIGGLMVLHPSLLPEKWVPVKVNL